MGEKGVVPAFCLCRKRFVAAECDLLTPGSVWCSTPVPTVLAGFPFLKGNHRGRAGKEREGSALWERGGKGFRGVLLAKEVFPSSRSSSCSRSSSLSLGGTAYLPPAGSGCSSNSNCTGRSVCRVRVLAKKAALYLQGTHAV